MSVPITPLPARWPRQISDPFATAGFSGYPACAMTAAEGDLSALSISVLTIEEQDRVSRLFSADRRFELAGSLLARRELIAAMTECQAHEVRIETLAEGAPRLSVPHGWSISIANKGAQTVVALAPEPQAIGVDIEHVRPINWRPILPVICGESDRTAFTEAAGSGADDLRAFFRMWTIKEAVLKSTTLGFKANPKEIRINVPDLYQASRGELTAFGRRFRFWTAGEGDTLVSLVRRQS